MNLQKVNEELGEIVEPFIEAQEEYSNFQMELDNKKAQLYMLEDVMGLKNAEMRDAYVHKCLDAEGLLERKLNISNNFYRLKHKRDLLVELSKNLRIIEAK